MARPRKKKCPNCEGTNEKCKYLVNGRKCSKGKAVGKAKGKAVSEKTIKKREEYDSIIGDLHTDYLNEMRNKQIRKVYDEQTGEVLKVDQTGKVYSFERWLNLNGNGKYATWIRRHYKDISSFNFYDI